jgi:hypothetical protein
MSVANEHNTTHAVAQSVEALRYKSDSIPDGVIEIFH